MACSNSNNERTILDQKYTFEQWPFIEGFIKKFTTVFLLTGFYKDTSGAYRHWRGYIISCCVLLSLSFRMPFSVNGIRFLYSHVIKSMRFDVCLSNTSGRWILLILTSQASQWCKLMVVVVLVVGPRNTRVERLYN